MSVLVFNAGSTSLKFGLFSGTDTQALVSGDLDWAAGDRQQAQLVRKPRQGPVERSCVAAPDDRAAAACAVRAVLQPVGSGTSTGSPTITAIGHRVVHGGTAFCQSARIDDQVKAAIGRLSELAPLHNPPTLRAIEAAEAALPGVPQVAVFDTAFYAHLPPRAFLYPVPYAWYQRYGLRRFGFHGISHAYCAGRAADFLGRDPEHLRLVSCHLGGGCSATAIRNGMPVATTMGYSPLEGLMMGTRSGSVDPGMLLDLQRTHRLTVTQIDHALNYESGLLGVSGLSPDLARIEAAAAGGDERAQLAFDLFADRIRAAIGSLATALGGVDAVIFTDRIGEHSPALRAAVCAGLEFMGVCLDPVRNAQAQADVDVAAADSPARILVLHTREEWMVAREVARLVPNSLA